MRSGSVARDDASLVGAEGFEPTTSSSQSWRSTRLSYTPAVKPGTRSSGAARVPNVRRFSFPAQTADPPCRRTKRVPKHPVCISGAPGEIRTPDHQVRSLVLYPAELRARRKEIMGDVARIVNAFAETISRHVPCTPFQSWRSERDSNPRSGF